MNQIECGMNGDGDVIYGYKSPMIGIMLYTKKIN